MQPKTKAQTQVFTLYACFFLIQMSFKGNSTLVSLYSLSLGASVRTISLAIAAYSLSALLFAVHIGRLCDTLGDRKIILTGSLGCALSMALPAFVPNSMAAVFGCQLLFGLAQAMVQVSVQNLLGKLSPGEQRIKNFGMLSIVMSLGNTIAPVIIGAAISASGFRATYALSSFFALAGMAVALLFLKAAAEPPAALHHVSSYSAFISRDLLIDRQIRKMLLVSATVMTGETLFSFYIPIYASGLGHSPVSIGFYSAAYSLAFLSIRIIMPALMKRFTQIEILFYSLIVAGGGYVLMSRAVSGGAIIAVCYIVGLGLGCGYPITMNLAQEAAPPGRSGEVIGIRLTVNRLTQLCVPALTSLITSSVVAIFVGLGAFLLGSSVLYSPFPGKKSRKD